MESVSYFILVPMVYIAFAVFIIGTIIRLIKIFSTPPNPSTLQIFPARGPAWLLALYDTFLFPSVRRHKPILWVFLLVFHAALLLLIIGHLELFAEIPAFQIIPHEVFLGQGYIGLILAVTLLFFLFRRFFSPVKELTIAEDYLMLILLFIIIIFGSEMDWARRWYGYGEMTVEDYRLYLMSLLTFHPELPEGIVFSGHSFMLVIHVFFANLFIMYFPFSQMMHSFFAIPINRLRRG